MVIDSQIKLNKKKVDESRNAKRGRPAIAEWQNRARFLLRHLGDPITIEDESPLCHLPAVERLASAHYRHSIVPRGRALNNLAEECLQEIEEELDGHKGLSKLKQFVHLTRQGMGVTASSREIGVTPEYTCRTFKRKLVELLTDKLITRLR